MNYNKLPGGPVRNLFTKLWKKWTKGWSDSEDAWEDEPEEEIQEVYYENPYLGELREIMEQVLQKRNISYAKFAPVLVEGEELENVLQAASDLSADLNCLTIIADDGTYYEDFADNMYREHGLIVKVWPKKALNGAEILSPKITGNVILDFQKTAKIKILPEDGKKLYIPIFRRRWERCANLDIAVPIGYNTVIVGGGIIEKKQPERDQLEQAFYEIE